MLQGFGLGAGSSIGHRSVDALFGQGSVGTQQLEVKSVDGVGAFGSNDVGRRPESLSSKQPSLEENFGSSPKKPVEPSVSVIPMANPDDDCTKHIDLYNSCRTNTHEIRDCSELYEKWFVCSIKRDNC
jgi:hypothetical protein